MRAPRVPAVALLMSGAISVQFGAAFAVTLFATAGPGGTVLLRLALGGLILLAIFRPRLRGRPREDLGLALAFGLVLGGMNWSFYESIDRIPLGAAVTFEFVGPLGVAVWGSRRPLDFAWILLAAAGILLLANPFGETLDPAGIALAFVAGGFWAAYILVAARVGRVWPGGTGLAIGCAAGALVALPAGLVQAGGELLDPALLASGAAVGLLSSVIPYSLEMEALRRISEALFGVLMSLEPAIAAVAGLLVLDQDLVVREILAIGLVVLACAGATWQARGPASVPSGPG